MGTEEELVDIFFSRVFSSVAWGLSVKGENFV